MVFTAHAEYVSDIQILSVLIPIEAKMHQLQSLSRMIELYFLFHLSFLWMHT